MPWEHVLYFNKNSQEDTFKRLCFCYLFGVWHLLSSLDSHLQQFFLNLPDFVISRIYSWFLTFSLIKRNSDLEIHGPFITDSCLIEEEWTMSQSKKIQDDFNTTTWSEKYVYGAWWATKNWVVPWISPAVVKALVSGLDSGTDGQILIVEILFHFHTFYFYFGRTMIVPSFFSFDLIFYLNFFHILYSDHAFSPSSSKTLSTSPPIQPLSLSRNQIIRQATITKANKPESKKKKIHKNIHTHKHTQAHAYMRTHKPLYTYKPYKHIIGNYNLKAKN